MILFPVEKRISITSGKALLAENNLLMTTENRKKENAFRNFTF